MNNRKICFISCVNDSEQYHECLRYIHSLEVPEGYTVETLAVEDAPSMTAGYNHAMRQSDAKYKVYLHQDVRILHKQFLRDVVSLFETHEELGMLGVAGAWGLPNNAVWWESNQRYGKVYDSHTGTMQELSFHEVTGSYQPVHALDGLILITQYDLLWREDLFRGWHFYDLSQCAEFRIAGFQVGVPHQDRPWVLHDCGIVNVSNGFEEYRNLYRNEYHAALQAWKRESAQELPLVSVLIPAYNRPKLLEIALNSVLEQTYPNLEVIICDDSSTDDVQEMIQPFLQKYPNIYYERNERNLFAENPQKCFDLSNGEYVNFLMDDDVFHPQKIEKMMNYFLANDEITMVTSFRQLIDIDGNLLRSENLAFRRLFDEPRILDGLEVGNFVLENCSNVIGEPTTVLFRKSALIEKYGRYKNRQYSCINDLASWILLLGQGKLAYLPDPLSSLRMHEGQNSKSLPIILPAITQWYTLIRDSREDGFLADDKQYKKALLKHFSGCIWLLQLAVDKNELALLTEEERSSLHSLIEELTK